MSRNWHNPQDVTDLPLFGLPVRARVTDPPTSAEADAALRRRGTLAAGCAETLRALREYVELWGDPPTTAELANGDAALVHLYGRRLPDLRKLGKVENGAARVCRKTGARAQTWLPRGDV